MSRTRRRERKREIDRYNSSFVSAKSSRGRYGIERNHALVSPKENALFDRDDEIINEYTRIWESAHEYARVYTSEMRLVAINGVSFRIERYFEYNG